MVHEELQVQEAKTNQRMKQKQKTTKTLRNKFSDKHAGISCKSLLNETETSINRPVTPYIMLKFLNK